MAIQHMRLPITARLLRRCPKCGQWRSLRQKSRHASIAGMRVDYACQRCGAEMQDWKPSAGVKF